MAYPWSELDAALIGEEVSSVDGTLTNLNFPSYKGGPTGYSILVSGWLPRVLPPGESASMLFAIMGSELSPVPGSEHLHIAPDSLVVTSSDRLLCFASRTLVFEADMDSVRLRPSLSTPLLFELEGGVEVTLNTRSIDVHRAVNVAWHGLPILYELESKKEAERKDNRTAVSRQSSDEVATSGSGWLLVVVGIFLALIGGSSLAEQAPLIEGVPLLATPIADRPAWRELLDYVLVIGGGLAFLAGLAKISGGESLD